MVCVDREQSVCSRFARNVKKYVARTLHGWLHIRDQAYAIRWGVLLLWSVLWLWVWDFTIVTLLAKWINCTELHCFYKIQNASLILSQDTRENRPRNRSCDKKPLFRLRSLSLSLFLSYSLSFFLSRSRTLSLSSALALSLFALSVSGALFPSFPIRGVLPPQPAWSTSWNSALTKLDSHLPPPK